MVVDFVYFYNWRKSNFKPLAEDSHACTQQLNLALTNHTLKHNTVMAEPENLKKSPDNTAWWSLLYVFTITRLSNFKPLAEDSYASTLQLKQCPPCRFVGGGGGGGGFVLISGNVTEPNPSKRNFSSFWRIGKEHEQIVLFHKIVWLYS